MIDWIPALAPLLAGLLLLFLLGRELLGGLWPWLRGPWLRAGGVRPGRALLAGQLRARGEPLRSPDGAACVWRRQRFRLVLGARQPGGQDASRFLDHIIEEQVPAELAQGPDEALSIDLDGAEPANPRTWIEPIEREEFLARYPSLSMHIVPGVERVEIHSLVVPEQARLMVSGMIEERPVPPPGGADAGPRPRRAPRLVLASAPDVPLRISLGTRAGLLIQSAVAAGGALLLAICLLGLGAVGFYERWVAGRLAAGWP